MLGTPRVLVTLAVFAMTVALVVLRPRRWHEAWWTAAGAGAMLALRLVSPGQALSAVLGGKDALLFLLALLVLSLLIGKSGFFEWAAIRCARVAAGDGRALYRNTFVLGALITATLSLDTTAVILTPVVLAIVKRLRIRALPYVALCALVANVGSLALPISNLTNILFAATFHQTFAAFAARMLVPQVVALLVLYGALRWHFRGDLPATFDPESLPALGSVVPSRAYFVACISVLLLVLCGYFVAPVAGVEPYVVAFGGVLVLAVAGALTGRAHARDLAEVSWGVFPFVIGLFVAVRAVENLGFADAASGWLAAMHRGSIGKMLATSVITAVASNVMNNLPAALLVRSILQGAQVHARPVFAALVGADVGAIVTPFGSLATMLVIALARQAGAEVSTRRLMGLGAALAPVLVVVTTLAVAATFVVLR